METNRGTSPHEHASQNERTIVGLLLDEIVKQSDYEFAISYVYGYDIGEEQMTYTRVPAEALKHIQACGMEHIMVRKPGADKAFAWILLVYGEGSDGREVISDYTASMDRFVEPVMNWIDANIE